MFSRYYQEELAYLREMGREFSRAYPEFAPMLADAGADPSVERLLEGVAFLTGRIREKLDDELPEAIHAIASLLFPQMIRPVPSACIVELTPQMSMLREALIVPRGSIFGSVPVDGTACQFRSTVDCLLVPWEIEDVACESIGGGRQQIRISVRLRSFAAVGALGGRSARFHLAAERRSALDLLAYLHERLDEIVVVEPNPRGGRGREIVLTKDAFRLVGFGEEESLLLADKRLFPGYRLLQEYYTLPEKFAFFELFDLARGMAGGPDVDRYDICLRCKGTFADAGKLDRDWIKLHCVPAVNLFDTSTEPVRLSPKRSRYRLRVAGHTATAAAVFAINRVTCAPHSSKDRVEIPYFYDFAHAGKRASASLFYDSHIVPSIVGEGTDICLSFGTPRDVDVVPNAEFVSVDIVATNGRLASALRAGDLRVVVPGSPAIAKFKNLASTSHFVPAPIGREFAWRTIAHTAMGLRSLASPEVLRAVMETYNFQALVDRQAARANELRVQAIGEMTVKPTERLIRGTPVRGVAIDIAADEDGFGGEGDMFLFSAILDRLYGDYVSLNSFSQVSMTGTATQVRYSWPARNGSTRLL